MKYKYIYPYLYGGLSRMGPTYVGPTYNQSKIRYRSLYKNSSVISYRYGVRMEVSKTLEVLKVTGLYAVNSYEV